MSYCDMIYACCGGNLIYPVIFLSFDMWQWWMHKKKLFFSSLPILRCIPTPIVMCTMCIYIRRGDQCSRNVWQGKAIMCVSRHFYALLSLHFVHQALLFNFSLYGVLVNGMHKNVHMGCSKGNIFIAIMLLLLILLQLQQ